MSGVSDFGVFLGKCLELMTGNEPGGFDVMFLEELQDWHDANMTGEKSSADIVSTVFSAI